MRVVITTRFDIEVENRQSVELVGQWLCERIMKGGLTEVFNGIAVVYDYPEHPNTMSISIDQQWDMVKASATHLTLHEFSESSPFHPDAVSLLVASGEVAL